MSRSAELPTLIVTARDPSTAYAFENVIDSLLDSRRFSLRVFAQNPAFDILHDSPVAKRVEVSLFEDAGTIRGNVARAEGILVRESVCAVLTGVSGPDVGVDEWFLCACDNRGVESYALQSFWGDVNENVGARANTYLVQDDFAAAVTSRKINGVTKIVGSPQHDNLLSLDIELERARFFSTNNLTGKKNRIIGFYGQPLDEVGGYRETVQAFVSALIDLDDVALFYRPHPKESASQVAWCSELLSSVAEDFWVDMCLEAIPSLCASDLVVSPFSSCGYDLQCVLKGSSTPMGVPLYLFFNRELVSWYREYTGLETIPMLCDRNLCMIEDESRLASYIDAALTDHSKKLVWSDINTGSHSALAASKVIAQLLSEALPG